MRVCITSALALIVASKLNCNFLYERTGKGNAAMIPTITPTTLCHSFAIVQNNKDCSLITKTYQLIHCQHDTLQVPSLKNRHLETRDKRQRETRERRRTWRKYFLIHNSVNEYDLHRVRLLVQRTVLKVDCYWSEHCCHG